jgi:hypothetical protein
MCCIVLQVKKGYKDKVGIILYNVESGDGRVQDGFQELVAMGDLNCKKIHLMQEHAKSGTYVEAGKTNATKPCKSMFHESNSGSCHLTNAVRAAQQVGTPLSIPSADPCCHGFPCAEPTAGTDVGQHVMETLPSLWLRFGVCFL